MLLVSPVIVNTFESKVRLASPVNVPFAFRVTTPSVVPLALGMFKADCISDTGAKAVPSSAL